MALVIKGEMPTCCGFCCECLGGGSYAYYCNRVKRQISEVVPPYDKRMEWCPILGEIPEKYGRLIDSDELYKIVSSMDKCSMSKVLEYILDAPTILEASNG